ncbi:hypothetical protein D915_009776 [Fasciola hepatica]|uniref:Uncharacterized protein n=1 Tax=Fasciola hepatica TaxID=6192 RepID=A0A4E0QX33_FASHE|nr:hypothetical protein D915_009776 [Fasciola hepatica]
MTVPVSYLATRLAALHQSTSSPRIRGLGPRNSNVGADAVPSSLPITFSNAALRPTKCSANDNKVVRWLVSTLSRRGLRVLVEPIIPLAQPFCKPDLTVCNGALVYVLDVCVVSGRSAESAWRTKVEKHSATLVEDSIKRTLGQPTVTFKHYRVIISNHGLLLKRWGSGLRHLDLCPSDLARACQLVVKGSLKTYDV